MAARERETPGAAPDNSQAPRVVTAAPEPERRPRAEAPQSPIPETAARPAAPPADSVSPSSPPPPAATPDDVAAAVSHYRDVIIESASALRELAATWQGSAAEEKEFSRLVTRAWQAARAIVDDRALLAALRQQHPDDAPLVEGLARKSVDETIAQALRKMPQPTPEPEPKPEPEPDPEPPSFGMGMR